MNQLLVIDGVSVRQYFESNYCLNDLRKLLFLPLVRIAPPVRWKFTSLCVVLKRRLLWNYWKKKLREIPVVFLSSPFRAQWWDVCL